MQYADLADRLRAATPATLTAFPDGSVDVYFRVKDAGGYVHSLAEFGQRVASRSSKSFRLERGPVEPGGQTVNVARQAAALGDDVTLYGHLDHPVFADLPFETHSMGAPAEVHIYDFDDGDFMLSESSPDVTDWEFADLVAAAPGEDALRRALEADVVCCANWVSMPGIETALERLAGWDIDGGPFVFDAGDVSGLGVEEVERALRAVGRLESTYDVVVSANRGEIEHYAALLGVGRADDATKVDAIREAAGVSAVVLHDHPETVAATPDGAHVVRNIFVAEPRRQTGAGDRFGAGVAHALARGWEWDAVCALGNACASYYVETAQTADAETLAAYLRAVPT